jgi:hypothetical protein
MRSLFLIVPLLLAVPLAAQETPSAARTTGSFEVTGRVLDGATGEPIAEAVVRLADAGALAVSDSAGRFVLRGVPRGTHPWQISRIGYSTWNEEVEADPEDEFTIRLLPKPEVLEGLVVVGDRFRDRRAASGMSVRVLEGGEVARTSGSDLHAFVQARLGVPLMTCGGEDVEQNCAWLRGDKVSIVVFVDEERATDGLSRLHAIPPTDVHSIEMYSGGTMIRVYTTWFMERAARGRVTLMPLPYSPGVPLIGALNRQQ